MQGDTREASYVLVGGPMQDRELSYVQLSRHRGEAHIYASTEEVGKTLETMADVMSRSRQKEIAQEKRERGLEIAPAANQKSREEAVRMERKPEEQQRRQAARGMAAVVSLLEHEFSQKMGRPSLPTRRLSSVMLDAR